MMSDDDKFKEPEDFEKVVSFESGEFAIVDARVIRSLKGQVPLVNKAIFVATKQSREEEQKFKVTALYDDATLRELKIVPYDESEAEDEEVKESVQILGHEEDPVKKKLSRINRIGSGVRPKTGDRKERNKRKTTKGDGKTRITSRKSKAEYRIDQKTSIDGARRKRYGQRFATECVNIIKNFKDGRFTDSYLESIENLDEIRNVLVEIRDDGHIKGKTFDVVYEAIAKIDEYRLRKSNEWIRKFISNDDLEE